jgi:hypothetical protein
VPAIKKEIITAAVSLITTSPTIGRFRGAAEPPVVAKAPNEVAKRAIPARPRISRRFARTLATANLYILLLAERGMTPPIERSDIELSLVFITLSLGKKIE